MGERILGLEVIEDERVPATEAWITERPRYAVYIEDCRVVVERQLSIVAKITGLPRATPGGET